MRNYNESLGGILGSTDRVHEFLLAEKMYPGKWAKETPDKPAVINSTTGASISFLELT